VMMRGGKGKACCGKRGLWRPTPTRVYALTRIHSSAYV
jgi:hypothetical protein